MRRIGILGMLLFLLFSSGILALEPDDLRLGMKPDEVASVYTSLRSCSNSEFVDTPDFMAWGAELYNRNARVEVRFDQGISGKILIRIYLGQGDDGADVLRVLAEDNSRVAGPPIVDKNGIMVWRTGSGFKKLLIVDTHKGREIQLAISQGAGNGGNQ